MLVHHSMSDVLDQVGTGVINGCNFVSIYSVPMTHSSSAAVPEEDEEVGNVVHESWNGVDAHSIGDDSEVGGGSDHGHGHGPWLYRSDAYQCCLGNRQFRRGITPLRGGVD